MDFKSSFLPIGSVVSMKDAEHKVLIMGYYPWNLDKQIFEYMGVPYPEGVITSQTNLYFNRQNIEKVYAIGFMDDEAKEQLKYCDDIYKNLPKKEDGTLDEVAILADSPDVQKEYLEDYSVFNKIME